MNSGSRSVSRSVSVSRSSPVASHSRSSSVSVPRSPSVASHSCSPSVLSTTEQGGGPSKLSKEDKDSLLEYLGIDTNLPYIATNLHTAYKKHVAISTSTQKVLSLSQDQEWQALMDPHPWNVSLKDFIDIFVAKSQYYGTWKQIFEEAERFPAMHDWLALEDDQKSDKAIWGEIKSTYSFDDLRTWIHGRQREQKAAEQNRDQKSKSPEKKKSKKKKIKKTKQDDSE